MIWIMDSLSETPSDYYLSSDVEWLLLNAIRQTFGIGRKSPITYAEAARLAVQLAPNLIERNSELLNTFDAGLVQLYKALAAVQSKSQNKVVKPVHLLDKEIRSLKRDASHAQPEQMQIINAQIEKLERAKIASEESNWTEDEAIHHDSDIPDPNRNLPVSRIGQGYKEYWVTNDRRLRVKVLHPNRPEWLSGVDLIYENYYDKKTDKNRITSQVRVAALQYKMWDGKNLYTSEAPSLLSQLEKMENTFCNSGFCKTSRSQNYSTYRLPYCSAFLRPTDKTQLKNTFKVTHAWHVPVCVVIKKFEQTSGENKVLRSNLISNSSTTQEIFQEMFNRGMLGSDWMSVSKLKKLYGQIGIFDNLDRIIIHAQEYSASS